MTHRLTYALMLMHVIILDDISALAELIRATLIRESGGRYTVDTTADEGGFKNFIDAEKAGGTVLMVNAAYKPFPSSSRNELAGVSRVIKRAIRLTWVNLCPVIAYCTIPPADFLGQQSASLFRGDAAHTYVNIAECGHSGLKEAVESARGVPNLDALRTTIYGHCRAELADIINSALHHPLSKVYKLATVGGRLEYLACLAQLLNVLRLTPDEEYELLELRRMISDPDQGNSTEVKSRIAKVSGMLSRLSKSLTS